MYLPVARDIRALSSAEVATLPVRLFSFLVRRGWGACRNYAHPDGLLTQPAHTPERHHRHVGSIPPDRDGHQRLPHSAARRVHIVPGALEVDLSIAVEILWLQGQRVSGDVACRHTQRPAEGNHEVGNIAADADTLGRRVE